MNNTLYLVRMDTIRRNAKGADAAIAEYLFTHPEKTPHLTLQSLAEETHTFFSNSSGMYPKSKQRQI